MPKVFYKTIKEEADKVTSNTNFGKWILGFLAIIVVLAVVGYAAIGLYQNVAKSWDEIMFAYNKPEIVKTVRIDYEAKANKLERSFLNQQKDEKQEIIDAIVDKIQKENLN